MRQILVDHARARQAVKRGADQLRISLSDMEASVENNVSDLLALDEALNRLEETDERMCKMIEMRYFGGLTITETAEALGVSHTTVEKDWKFARAWLQREMS